MKNCFEKFQKYNKLYDMTQFIIYMKVNQLLQLEKDLNSLRLKSKTITIN